MEIKKMYWDWFNQTNHLEGCKNELQPMVENIINEFSVDEIIISPEMAVIFENIEFIYIVSGDDLVRDDGSEFTYVIHDENDEPKCDIYIDRKIENDVVIFKSKNIAVCELNVNVGDLKRNKITTKINITRASSDMGTEFLNLLWNYYNQKDIIINYNISPNENKEMIAIIEFKNERDCVDFLSMAMKRVVCEII